MPLQTRIALTVTAVVVIGVLGTSTALTWSAQQSALSEMEAEGVLVASLLAKGAGFALDIPGEVEDGLSQQMVGQVMGLTAGKHAISIVNRGPGPVAVDAIVVQ